MKKVKVEFLKLPSVAYLSWIEGEVEEVIEGYYEETFDVCKGLGSKTYKGVYFIIYYPNDPTSPDPNTLYVWFRYAHKALRVRNVEDLVVKRASKVSYNYDWNKGAIDFLFSDVDKVKVTVWPEMGSVIIEGIRI